MRVVIRRSLSARQRQHNADRNSLKWLYLSRLVHFSKQYRIPLLLVPRKQPKRTGRITNLEQKKELNLKTQFEKIIYSLFPQFISFNCYILY